MMEAGVYQSLDHALRRAFGDPIPHVSSSQWMSAGVMRVFTGLPPGEQIIQDAYLKRSLLANCTPNELSMFYMIYTPDKFHAYDAAVELSSSVAAGNGWVHEWVLQQVIEFSRRKFEGWRWYRVKYWKEKTGLSYRDLRKQKLAVESVLREVEDTGRKRARYLFEEAGVL